MHLGLALTCDPPPLSQVACCPSHLLPLYPRSLVVLPTSSPLSQVACGTDDGSIHVWDLGSARKVASLQGHVGPVWSLAYSHGAGAILASGERTQ